MYIFSALSSEIKENTHKILMQKFVLVMNKEQKLKNDLY